jgi:hypothetical protein
VSYFFLLLVVNLLIKVNCGSKNTILMILIQKLLLILLIINNSNLQKVIWFLGHGVLSIQTIKVFNFFKDKFIRSGRPYFIKTAGEDYS